MNEVKDPWELRFTDEEAEVLKRLEDILSKDDFDDLTQVMWQVKFHSRPS